MVFVAYCEAADYDVITTLRKAGIKGYTKFTEVFGEGKETQPRLGTQCWPGKNNFLAIAVEDEELNAVVATIREIKKKHPRAGIKVFIMPLETMF